MFEVSRQGFWLNLEKFSKKILFILSENADEIDGIFLLLMKIYSGKILVRVLFVFVLFAFASCKSEVSETAKPPITREVTDDLGKKIALAAEVKRAVSLAPNLTEIIFAVGAGDRLVGVTTFCNYPEEAEKIQKVGDTLKPNIENIIRSRRIYISRINFTTSTHMAHCISTSRCFINFTWR